MKHFRTRRGHLSFAILELASEREKDSPRAGLFLWIYKGISPVLRGLCPLGDVAFALPFRGAKGDLPVGGGDERYIDPITTTLL